MLTRTLHIVRWPAELDCTSAIDGVREHLEGGCVMDDSEMPVASPNEAALLFAYARLVGLLDQANVISAEAVAADLERYAASTPEQARPLLLNMAERLRPAGARLRLSSGLDDSDMTQTGLRPEPGDEGA